MTLIELKHATRTQLIAYLQALSHEHLTDEELRLLAYENFRRLTELTTATQADVKGPKATLYWLLRCSLRQGVLQVSVRDKRGRYRVKRLP